MVALLIKKIIIIPFFTFVLGLNVVISQGIDISASSAVVINADTKEIVYEKNAFVKRSMASTTKIMTSIIAIESGKLNSTVTVTSSAMTEGSSVGLKEGYKLTLDSLVYGMMLESGNDAANVCALFLGESFDKFAKLMNYKAKQIGMNDTNFVTPSGLDAEEHYTTAYDMALLGAYSIKNPVFREIVSTKKKKVGIIEPEMSLYFSNHNKLLDTCEGVFGIKTGFTKKSGRCLVTSCERAGATLVCVTLNAGDDWNDHRKLYDYCFSELNMSTQKITDVTNVRIFGSPSKTAEVFTEEYLYHYKDFDEIYKQIILPEIIYAPVKKNEIIGKVNYFSGGNLIHTSFIYSKNDVPSAEETYKKKFGFKDWINKLFDKRKENHYDRR